MSDCFAVQRNILLHSLSTAQQPLPGRYDSNAWFHAPVSHFKATSNKACAVSSFSIIIAEENGSVNFVGVPAVLLYYLYDISVLIALLYIDRLCI